MLTAAQHRTIARLEALGHDVATLPEPEDGSILYTDTRGISWEGRITRDGSTEEI